MAPETWGTRMHACTHTYTLTLGAANRSRQPNDTSSGAWALIRRYEPVLVNPLGGGGGGKNPGFFPGGGGGEDNTCVVFQGDGGLPKLHH